jgi:hypothetical protein
MKPFSLLNLLTLEWLFLLFNRATYIWVDLIQNSSICNDCHMEICVFKSCLARFQGIEELAIVTVCNMDLLNDIIDTIYSVHLAMHFA